MNETNIKKHIETRGDGVYKLALYAKYLFIYQCRIECLERE